MRILRIRIFIYAVIQFTDNILHFSFICFWIVLVPTETNQACSETTRFFYKQHFYKQRQAEIGKKLSES